MLSSLPDKLLRNNILDSSQIEQLKEDAQKQQRSFYQQILRDDSIEKARIQQVAAELSQMAYVDINKINLDNLPLSALPPTMLDQNQVLPLSKKHNRLLVAIGDPENESALAQARFQSNQTIAAVLCDPDKLHQVIGKVSSGAEGIGAHVGDINLEELLVDEDEDEDLDAVDLDPENAIVQYVNKILRDAINRDASDIHIEPYENDARIRYRIDGVLHTAGKPPLQLVKNIVSRIKVLARLDIAERRLPQDGRIKIRFSRTRTIDFRISTMPTLFGEKIVMRILDQGAANLKLDTLGMDPKQLSLYQYATKQPHGMILVTGPTGSGKTVTLYSALDTLNSPDINISSAEDPVEIYADGINQVSISEKSGLTFARTLRAFLRQDPDILMVGEIRDLETADISIKAAQTGHLVLSTLHTNDAPSAITRLINMGVAPFNIASTVNLVIAQRLVRVLCDNCKEEADIPKDALLDIGFNEEMLKKATIFSPSDCSACTNGYKGRTGIFEMMPVSDQTSELIMKKETEAEITRQVRSEGTNSLKDEGLKKVAAGITSLEEVERVTKS